MSNWFGDLALAYKFTIVFLGLLILTITAGLIKVFYNRRKLAKFVKEEQLEAGQKEDTVELTQREKDEGDLFGIRAIEAGFFAGVAQSRPTSRAGSVMDASVASSRTLTGGATSPFMKNSMANNSALSLNLGSSRDSETLGDDASRKLSTPAIRLRPSEAELSGRHNHNGTVDMSLNVPPSPGYRGTRTPSFGGSDDGESDGFTSPRSMSPNGAQSNPQHYAPLSPNLPSPGNPPETRLPTLPDTALSKDSRSPSPQDYSVRVEQPHSEPSNPSAPFRHLQPQVHTPTHQSYHHREGSGEGSVYSLARSSSNQPYTKHSERVQSATRTDFSTPGHSDQSQVPLHAEKKANVTPLPSQTSTLLAPGSDATKDARLSDFYDAYYRQSQLNPGMASSSS